jgi:hypothetical protein
VFVGFHTADFVNLENYKIALHGRFGELNSTIKLFRVISTDSFLKF